MQPHSITPTKVCPRCGESKPLSEFLIRKTGRKAGRPRGACKTCERAAHKAYRAANPGVDAAYKSANRDKYAAYESARRAALGDEYNAYMRAYQAAHPERRAAGNAVNNAVQAGKMPHISTQACCRCGKQAEQYHHHLGYDKENWLNVIAVCRLCHEQEHHADE